MTKTQARVLAFIRKFIAEHGYSPSGNEIAAAIGINQSSVVRNIRGLAQRGYLIKGPGWRNVELVENAHLRSAA